LSKKIKGIYPVLITPMLNQEEIDWEGYKKNIEYFIDQGVEGIAINGSTGEFVSLSTDERYKAVEMAVELIDGRINLIVGTAAERTSEAIAHTKQAEAAGADAALLINSYYAGPTDEEVYEQFKAVAESVSFPVMIYNNPSTTGVNIGTETILQVAKDVKNITHIKESSGDITKVRDIIRQGREDIDVFCGAEDLSLESILIGTTGWISVSANIAPKVTMDMFDAVQNQAFDKAWDLYDQLLPLCDFLEGSGKYVQITNRAMELKGLAGGPCRLPRLPLTDDEDAKLQALMKNLGEL